MLRFIRSASVAKARNDAFLGMQRLSSRKDDVLSSLSSYVSTTPCQQATFSTYNDVVNLRHHRSYSEVKTSTGIGNVLRAQTQGKNCSTSYPMLDPLGSFRLMSTTPAQEKKPEGRPSTASSSEPASSPVESSSNPADPALNNEEQQRIKNRIALQRLMQEQAELTKAAAAEGEGTTTDDQNKNMGASIIQIRPNFPISLKYTAIALGVLAISYLAVPLYETFCQVSGFGGTTQRDQVIRERNSYMEKVEDAGAGDVPLREVTVKFEANVHPSMDWAFKPCQQEIKLRIGETALAFFQARNDFDRPFTGVSLYNVLPPQAGLYFNKIQCFCFDEQRLLADEEIDMPLFFFIDPAMADDWRMDTVDHVTLSYTFFPVGMDTNDNTPQAVLEEGNRATAAQLALPLKRATRTTVPVPGSDAAIAAAKMKESDTNAGDSAITPISQDKQTTENAT